MNIFLLLLNNMKKNIAIITGGDSAEYQISLDSAKIVLDSLSRKKYNSFEIIVKNNKWILSENNLELDMTDFSVKINSKKISFDYAFIVIHGPPAENGDIQNYLEQINIPYSSCNSKISKLTFNKFQCNKQLSKLGFTVAKSMQIVNSKEINYNKIIEEIGLPCFVKPNEAGSSYGITKAMSSTDLISGIKKAFTYSKTIIIEKYIQGTEVSCGVYKNNSQIISLPITEIISQRDFFDYKAKYEGFSEEITPANIEKNIYQTIQNTTIDIYIKMNLRGVCRIDYIIMNNTPYIIEINTIPGLSKESIIPQQISESGTTIENFLDILIKNTSK